MSQTTPLVQVFARQANGQWVLSTFEGLAGDFALTSVPLTVPLADVYRDAEWPAEESGRGDGP